MSDTNISFSSSCALGHKLYAMKILRKEVIVSRGEVKIKIKQSMCCQDKFIFLLFSFFGNIGIVSSDTITTSIIIVTITMTNTILIIRMKVEHTMAEKRVLESSAHPFIISLR